MYVLLSIMWSWITSLLQSCAAFVFEADDNSQLQPLIEMALDHSHCEVRLAALRRLTKKLKDGFLDWSSSSLTARMCQALSSETHPAVHFRFQRGNTKCIDLCCLVYLQMLEGIESARRH